MHTFRTLRYRQREQSFSFSSGAIYDLGIGRISECSERAINFDSIIAIGDFAPRWLTIFDANFSARNWRSLSMVSGTSKPKIPGMRCNSAAWACQIQAFKALIPSSTILATNAQRFVARKSILLSAAAASGTFARAFSAGHDRPPSSQDGRSTRSDLLLRMGQKRRQCAKGKMNIIG